jgi:RNase P/RNase MRP subunit POP5
MLNRRHKRRYISVVHAGEPTDSAKAIKNRFSDLFGTIATERASIRLIEQRGNESIIKCTLEQLENVLLSIALLDPPAVTIKVSGSIKHLRNHKEICCTTKTALS